MLVKVLTHKEYLKGIVTTTVGFVYGEPHLTLGTLHDLQQVKYHTSDAWIVPLPMEYLEQYEPYGHYSYFRT